MDKKTETAEASLFIVLQINLKFVKQLISFQKAILQQRQALRL